MRYTVTTTGTTEPLTLAEEKVFCEIDGARYDDLLTSQISAARAYAEAKTGLSLVTRTITEYFSGFPSCACITLRFAPVTVVSLVEYQDANGAWQTWSSGNYTADLLSLPGMVIKNASASWPQTGAYPYPVRVTYNAGDLARIPDQAKQAMRMLVAFWLENREDQAINEVRNPRKRAADLLLEQVSILV